jgi:hypothetical protein
MGKIEGSAGSPWRMGQQSLINAQTSFNLPQLLLKKDTIAGLIH